MVHVYDHVDVLYNVIVISVSTPTDNISLEIITERAGDISFANEARRIYDIVFRTVKRRMFAVMQPNSGHPYLSRWNGVHVDLETLGVADSVPEVLRDVTLSFVWGTPDNPVEFGAAWVTPRSDVPDGAIIIGYNVGKRDRQPFRISKAAKRARAKLGQMSKGSELHEDEDIIALIPQLFSARRTAFIHELRHAYDQLVRDDDGKMGDYMNDRLMSSDDSVESNFTTDDEMNAYITQGMEDTIEDFERHSRGRPTKDKAKRWAPSGTALWNRFSDNVSGAVKHFAGEEKLMRRAAARVADVWDDYVANLNEGHVINESFRGMQVFELELSWPRIAWALVKNDVVIAGAETHHIGGGWSSVDVLWASNPSAMYALMMTILATKERLIPSSMISPAAERIIKRWYDKHSNNGDYVVNNVNDRHASTAPAHLKAGYLGKNIKAPVKVTERLTRNDDRWKTLVKSVNQGFSIAYNDKKRTGFTEGYTITESFENMRLFKLVGGGTGDAWALVKNGNVVGGMETSPGPHEWSIVDTLWAEGAPSAYALLMGVLANSLGLVPSHDVSKAAQHVIKRWYDKHRFDMDYVVDNALNVPNVDETGDFLAAGYLPGPSVRSPAKLKTLNPKDKQWRELSQAVINGFTMSYADKEKTTKLGGAMRRSESNVLKEIDEDLEDAIAGLMKLPEFASIEAFAEAKIEDEEETYSTAELQALARNLYVADNKTVKARDLVTAPSSYREKVKKELEGYGLLFSARRAPKKHRGFSDPLHGSNRYAGNHGGSGFDNAYNREPSSGRTFDPKDSGSLGMGSKRR